MQTNFTNSHNKISATIFLSTKIVYNICFNNENNNTFTTQYNSDKV